MLTVSWHSDVTREVEEALATLPECESCPHDLYGGLLRIARREALDVAVVYDDGSPIAVAGLLRRSRLVAESATNWLFPGTGFPVVASRRIDALKALGLKVRLSWWRMGETVPDDPAIGDVSVKPTYRMQDIAKREEFWRSTDLRRNIKNIRNRTARMRVEVGNLAHVAPVVSEWHGRWAGGDADDIAVRARLAIAHALEPAGAHVTVALLDGDEIAAGATNFVHRGEMVAGVSHVSPKYRQLGVGVRLIDAVFDVAEQRGLTTFDLGGGADYKQKWAPIGGERAEFNVASARVRLLRRISRFAKRIAPVVTISS